MNVTPLKDEHLEDAARLVCDRYERLRADLPILPPQYAEVDTILPLLKGILKASGKGVAAIERNRLAGFLTGWLMPSFRGKRSTYSPEWANAAEPDGCRRIYEELYGHIASEWVGDGYSAHYISLFSNDADALKALHWMGFGMVAVDAIRDLNPVECVSADVDIRRADLQDIESVIDLYEALRLYHEESPIFLLREKPDRAYYEQWLQASDRTIWLACLKDEPVGFLGLGPADADVCTIIFDEGTTSAYAALTKESVRREGIAAALLSRALRSAQESGYGRCAVSFEPMNVVATRCWLRYFSPVCFSVVRYIDERLIKD